MNAATVLAHSCSPRSTSMRQNCSTVLLPFHWLHVAQAMTQLAGSLRPFFPSGSTCSWLGNRAGSSMCIGTAQYGHGEPLNLDRQPGGYFMHEPRQLQPGKLQSGNARVPISLNPQHRFNIGMQTLG